MSLEAWGDEGNVPTRWEDTAIKQEFEAIRSQLLKWSADNRKEFPNDEVKELADQMIRTADIISDFLSGPI